MKAYNTSAATLRAVLAHPSLQRVKIEETMEALASANADAKEISDELAAQGVTVDDSEVEAELEGLVADVENERKVQEQKEKEAKLTSLKAPKHVPQVSEETWTDHEMDEEYRHAKEGKLAV